jgi:alkylation response protein AidB-like acyl-CoA dehydrogenase
VYYDLNEEQRAFQTAVRVPRANLIGEEGQGVMIAAARTLTYRASALIDQGGAELNSIGAMAKCFASDTTIAVTVDAVQLLGGTGYTADFPVERFMRDAKVTQIYEGTNQIQRIVIARNRLR